MKRRVAAVHESVHGTFRKWRNVRLESGMRTKADVRRPLWIYGFTPWLSRAYEGELRTGYERSMLSPPCGDLPVRRVVDRAVESFFRIFRNISVPTYPNQF
jgi:hypothetical protein